ncbi:beta strand repeat-containing protein, partial [Chloroflexota bacterium]
FMVTVIRPLTNGTIITNTAQVTSTEVATITYSNDVTHVVQSSPNITISKEANPAHGTSVSPGQAITYTLWITNTGDEIAQNVVVTDTVPQYTNYVSGTTSTGTVNESGGLVTWDVGGLTVDVPVNASFVVTVTTPLTNNTLISNTGYVTYTGSSVITPSNTVTHIVSSSPNVTYTKIADPVGGSTLNLSLATPTQITYTIIVTNDGNANATNLVVTDTVPMDTSGSGLTPWTVGFLAGNGGVVSNTFVVTVNMPLPDMTVITNTYEVSYDEIPGMFTSTSAMSPTNVVTHLIRSVPVMSVTKTSVPTPTTVVTPGQVIVYSFAVTNSGTATATNFVLTDTIPTNTSYITNSASASAGASVITTTSMVTVTQANLAAVSGALTFTFAVRVDSVVANGTIISNVGSYTFDQSTTVSQTNVVTHLVESVPNITLTKTAIPSHGSPIAPGDTITYTITITNNGTGDATGVVLTDTVPQYTQYITATPSPTSTSPLAWNLSPISAGGGVATVTFSVQVTMPLANNTVISNSALLDIAETTGLSQTNVVTHLVRSEPVMTITKSAQPPHGNIINPGDLITYTITITNTGNANATNVTISDTIPVNTNFVSANPLPTIINGATFWWDVGPVTAPAGTSTIRFTVQVTSPLASGVIITNTAQVTVSEVSTVTYSNIVTHEVVSSPEITITKRADPPHGFSVVPGQTITYTLTVTNTGGYTATNVVVTDGLSIDVNYVTATPGVGTITSAGQVITWTIGDLATDTPVSAAIVVTVTTPLADNTLISNTSYVTYTGSAVITPSNTVTHLVRSSPNVTYTKIADPPAGSSITLSASTQITYTIIVTNNGNADVTDLVITDTVPISTTGAGLVPWNIGFLAGNGGMTSNTFVVTVDVPLADWTVITNVYEVGYAGQVFTSSAVMSATNVVTHLIRSVPVITVSKTAQPASGSSVGPNSTITYTIAVANNGTDAAAGVLITDTLPLSVNLVTASLSNGGTDIGSSNPLTA